MIWDTWWPILLVGRKAVDGRLITHLTVPSYTSVRIGTTLHERLPVGVSSCLGDRPIPVIEPVDVTAGVVWAVGLAGVPMSGELRGDFDVDSDGTVAMSGMLGGVYGEAGSSWAWAARQRTWAR